MHVRILRFKIVSRFKNYLSSTDVAHSILFKHERSRGRFLSKPRPRASTDDDPECIGER